MEAICSNQGIFDSSVCICPIFLRLPLHKCNLYCTFCWPEVSHCRPLTETGTGFSPVWLTIARRELEPLFGGGLFGYSSECRVQNKNRFMLAAFLSDSKRANFCDDHDHRPRPRPPKAAHIPGHDRT